ncbi:MAG: LytTR family transcriptional regulator [Coriobacteriaceae bacterium]|nr:LytTR family transcriptional regulator [Coriobacteriaceae bacterium]
MVIQHIQQEGQRDIKVVVTSAPNDPRATKIVDQLKTIDGKLIAYEPGTVTRRILPYNDVLFIEIHTQRCWIHCSGGIELESPQRLYELEESLAHTEFIRISKQVIVNFDKVLRIRPEFNRRLMLELEDSTQLLVTRSYVPEIKRRLSML